jgi:tripartite-type tricarboxylate transporter receptor subunit TctC
MELVGMLKRSVLGAVVSLLALTVAAHAQDFPNRLIRLMHGFPPGGNVDVVARLLAQDLSKAFGQTIVVEGKPGPGANLAAEAVATSEPDGYTLLLVAGLHPAVAAVYKKLRYRPVDDFAWISTASFYPFIVCVRKDSPLQSMADLLRAARANPDSITSGTAGVGSIHHMTTELIANQAGIKLLSVPYRGEAPAMTGLLSGDVNMALATTTLAAPHIRSGEVRALAVTSKTRWKDFPEVPTVAESGLNGFEVISWSGLAAPAGTPEPIVQRLNTETRRIIAAPELRARLESFGAEVRGTTPAEMRDLVERQLSMWTQIAKTANIQLE